MFDAHRILFSAINQSQDLIFFSVSDRIFFFDRRSSAEAVPQIVFILLSSKPSGLERTLF
jgi:hypothetical protein